MSVIVMRTWAVEFRALLDDRGDGESLATTVSKYDDFVSLSSCCTANIVPLGEI